MNALAFVVRFCPRGHALVGDRCIACTKEAERELAASRAYFRDASRRSREKQRAALAAKEARRAVKLDPERSVCGIHRDTGAVCKRCEVHRAWLAKDLAATKPHYVTLREREAARGRNDGWMTNYLHRPWGEHHPEDRR